MSTKDVGDRSVAMCLSLLLKEGFSVAIPWGDNQKYDLILDYKGRLLKIQCKTGFLSDTKDLVRVSTYSVSTKDGKTIRVPYSPWDVDFFMVYCPIIDKMYVIPFDESVSGGTTLRLTPTKNGQTKNVKMAKDYEFSGIFSMEDYKWDC